MAEPERASNVIELARRMRGGDGPSDGQPTDFSKVQQKQLEVLERIDQKLSNLKLIQVQTEKTAVNTDKEDKKDKDDKTLNENSSIFKLLGAAAKKRSGEIAKSAGSAALRGTGVGLGRTVDFLTRQDAGSTQAGVEQTVGGIKSAVGAVQERKQSIKDSLAGFLGVATPPAAEGEGGEGGGVGLEGDGVVSSLNKQTELLGQIRDALFKQFNYDKTQDKLDADKDLIAGRGGAGGLAAGGAAGLIKGSANDNGEGDSGGILGAVAGSVGGVGALGAAKAAMNKLRGGSKPPAPPAKPTAANQNVKPPRASATPRTPANPLKKFPRLMKFAKIPGISALLAGYEIYDVLSGDGSTKQKVAGVSGALGGLGGSIVGATAGATLGSVVPGFGNIIGALAGGIGGFFFGKSLTKGLAEWLLGEEVTAFPDPINDMINGSGAGPTGSAAGGSDGTPNTGRGRAPRAASKVSAAKMNEVKDSAALKASDLAGEAGAAGDELAAFEAQQGEMTKVVGVDDFGDNIMGYEDPEVQAQYKKLSKKKFEAERAAKEALKTAEKLEGGTQSSLHDKFDPFAAQRYLIDKGVDLKPLENPDGSLNGTALRLAYQDHVRKNVGKRAQDAAQTRDVVNEFVENNPDPVGSDVPSASQETAAAGRGRRPETNISAPQDNSQNITNNVSGGGGAPTRARRRGRARGGKYD